MAGRPYFDVETIKSTEPYSTQHLLQTVDVYRVTKARGAIWLMYPSSLLSSPPLQVAGLSVFFSFLHGGAWRDPMVTSEAGTTLINFIANSSPPIAVNGASINYRLSPHPAHPATTDPATVAAAMHPDHLNDVLDALGYLQATYRMDRYALVGHSAGAMLAFQALAATIQAAPLRQQQQQQHPLLPQPVAVYGIEGIYDLHALVDEYPAYREFVEGAFGSEPEAWPQPMQLQGYSGLVVLAHSDDDGLLSWRQTEEMKGRCERSLGVGGGMRVVKVAGDHDDVLQTGQFGAVVERYLREL